MKVLVISHNVFCPTSNMGRTLSAYFGGWDKENIAQLYIHSESPSDEICVNYYRITDTDAIKSIITRKSGTVFKFNNSENILFKDEKLSKVVNTLYKKGKSRTPIIYIARNLWWRLAAWRTKRLLEWVDSFAPDVIFFASGDYAFTYEIALKLAKYRSIPLVVSCMDDYFFYNKNDGRFLGKYAHKMFMTSVKKTMEYASCIFSICEKMSTDYGRYFKKPCYTLHTPSTISETLQYEKSNAISYIGNLGYKRNEQLVKLGRALKALHNDNKPKFIDVYSTESREELLEELTEENGIKFHGGISADKVLEVMGKSMAVIHTESFDESMRKRVAYSVSTKIADSLASGTCILAYGPKEVASIEYLEKNDAAHCITDDENLLSGLANFLADGAQRSRIVKNARLLAKENHDQRRNCSLIADRISALCGKNKI